MSTSILQDRSHDPIIEQQEQPRKESPILFKAPYPPDGNDEEKTPPSLFPEDQHALSGEASEEPGPSIRPPLLSPQFGASHTLFLPHQPIHTVSELMQMAETEKVVASKEKKKQSRLKPSRFSKSTQDPMVKALLKSQKKRKERREKKGNGGEVEGAPLPDNIPCSIQNNSALLNPTLYSLLQSCPSTSPQSRATPPPQQSEDQNRPSLAMGPAQSPPETTQSPAAPSTLSPVQIAELLVSLASMNPSSIVAQSPTAASLAPAFPWIQDFIDTLAPPPDRPKSAFTQVTSSPQNPSPALNLPSQPILSNESDQPHQAPRMRGDERFVGIVPPLQKISTVNTKHTVPVIPFTTAEELKEAVTTLEAKTKPPTAKQKKRLQKCVKDHAARKKKELKKMMEMERERELALQKEILKEQEAIHYHEQKALAHKELLAQHENRKLVPLSALEAIKKTITKLLPNEPQTRPQPGAIVIGRPSLPVTVNGHPSGQPPAIPGTFVSPSALVRQGFPLPPTGSHPALHSPFATLNGSLSGLHQSLPISPGTFLPPLPHSAFSPPAASINRTPIAPTPPLPISGPPSGPYNPLLLRGTLQASQNGPPNALSQRNQFIPFTAMPFIILNGRAYHNPMFHMLVNHNRNLPNPATINEIYMKAVIMYILHKQCYSVDLPDCLHKMIQKFFYPTLTMFDLSPTIDYCESARIFLTCIVSSIDKMWLYDILNSTVTDSRLTTVSVQENFSDALNTVLSRT